MLRDWGEAQQKPARAGTAVADPRRSLEFAAARAEYRAGSKLEDR
jgi:hypothetical protein